MLFRGFAVVVFVVSFDKSTLPVNRARVLLCRKYCKLASVLDYRSSSKEDYSSAKRSNSS